MSNSVLRYGSVFVFLTVWHLSSLAQTGASDTMPKAKAAHVDTTTNKSYECVFPIIERNPEYPGGIQALFAYIKSNKIYPPAAITAGIEGTVTVGFTVEVDGSITNIAVKRSLPNGGYGCNEEAIRLVKGMPKWTPGMYYSTGQLIRVNQTLPVRFRLSDIPVPTSIVTTDTLSSDTSQLTEPTNFMFDVAPSFPGGQAVLFAYLMDNLLWPAAQSEAQGLVVIGFVVETDGSITNVVVKRKAPGDLSPLDEEALRLVREMPKWSPAMLKGQPVRANQSLPIRICWH
jgi:TonB family protein